MSENEDYWNNRPRGWYCKQELPYVASGPRHCLRHAKYDGYCTQHWQVLQLANLDVSPKTCVWTFDFFKDCCTYVYKTGCGDEVCEDPDDLKRWKVCPYCGRQIERKEIDNVSLGSGV